MKFRSHNINKSLMSAVSKLIEPHSSVMLGQGDNILRYCKKSSGFNKDVKILLTHDIIRQMGKYDKDSGCFQLYSHTYGWRNIPITEDGYISIADKKIMKANPGQRLKLRGGGNRDQSSNIILHEKDIKFKLNENIVRYQQKSSNCCVWLAAALAIDCHDRNISTHMMKLLDENTPAYEWMFLTKIPKGLRDIYVSHNRIPLIQRLQDKTIGYTLMKIDTNKLQTTYMDYIFNEDTTGQYLCQLETQGGCKKHVVVIDCNQKVILDGCETHAIFLSQENLDYCCGKYLLGVRKIYCCYQLLKN